MAERIIKSLGRPMEFGDLTLLPGATLGYTVWPRDPSDPEGLLSSADKALYQAKSRGRGTWKAYDAETPRTGRQAKA
jgi:predicted signal transduction protein with EAL and GGDEF domain